MVAAATALYLALWPLALLLMPTSGIDGEPNDAFNLMGMATLVYILALIAIGLCCRPPGRGRRGPTRLREAGRGERSAPGIAPPAVPTICGRGPLTPVPATGSAHRLRCCRRGGRRGCRRRGSW